MAFDLTTLVRVKALLDLTEATKDTLLNDYIKAVSNSIEEFLNRLVLQEARTERYDVEPGQQQIVLRAFPVVDPPAPVFKNDSARQFGTGIITIAADSFFLDLRRGIAQFDRVRLIRGPGVFQAGYTGGMAIDTASFIIAFPEIARAAPCNTRPIRTDRRCAGISARRDDEYRQRANCPASLAQGKTQRSRLLS